MPIKALSQIEIERRLFLKGASVIIEEIKTPFSMIRRSKYYISSSASVALIAGHYYHLALMLANLLRAAKYGLHWAYYRRAFRRRNSRPSMIPRTEICADAWLHAGMLDTPIHATISNRRCILATHASLNPWRTIIISSIARWPRRTSKAAFYLISRK